MRIPGIDGIRNAVSEFYQLKYNKCNESQLCFTFKGNGDSTPSETSTSKQDTQLLGEKESPSDTSTNTQVKASLTFKTEEKKIEIGNDVRK